MSLVGSFVAGHCETRREPLTCGWGPAWHDPFAGRPFFLFPFLLFRLASALVHLLPLPTPSSWFLRRCGCMHMHASLHLTSFLSPFLILPSGLKREFLCHTTLRPSVAGFLFVGSGFFWLLVHVSVSRGVRLIYAAVLGCWLREPGSPSVLTVCECHLC